MTNPTNNLPGLHPPPPSDLLSRELPLKIIEAETILYRVHQARYEPIYFSYSQKSKVGYVRTGKEPVGEGDNDADFVRT